MAKSNGNNNMVGILIGLIIGALIMYIAYPSINPSEASTPDIKDAKVREINGVLIYFQSEPKVLPQVLGTLQEEKVYEIIQGLGDVATDKKKKWFEKIAASVGAIKENVNLRERLEAYVEAARQQYPEVQGLIFNRDDLKEATIIKF